MDRMDCKALVTCMVLATLCLLADAQVATQRERGFSGFCENCIVSRGHGYSPFDDDCNCFIICNFEGSFKLSAMASPWVGYKRCCGCGASYSREQLTCVDFRSKKSDCFFGDSAPGFEADNPCNGQPVGEMIPREDPKQFSGSLCSGFIRCVQVMNGSSFINVPEQDCCPDGECFWNANGMCSSSNCDEAGNTACVSKPMKDDCNCSTPPAEEKECPFMPVAGSPTEFMGVELMAIYHCPPGSCYDQTYCTCVQANNTGYTDCLPFLTSDFSGSGSAIGSVNTTDGRGALVYSANHGGVLSGGSYTVQEADFLDVVGTAAMEPGNTLVYRVVFTLEDDGTSENQRQCLFGNCNLAEQTEGFETDTIRVLIERVADGDADEILLRFVYQDTYSMVGNSMENLEINLGNDFENDGTYTLWAVFCGEDEQFGAAIFSGDSEDEADLLSKSASSFESNSQKLLVGQSGFQFGNCRDAQGFEGSFQSIEFYKCKPEGNAEFDDVFDELF